MNKLLLFIFISVMALSVKAQEGMFNQTDSKGRKQGHWEEKTNMGTTKGRYVDDKKDGSWVTYSPGDQLIRIESYNNGLLEGITVEIDQRGYLNSDSYYINNLLEGKVKRYFYGINLASVIEYTHGKINGKKMVYYENKPGKLLEESYYTNDVKNGPSNWYSDTGDPIAEYNYVNGLLEGVVKSYYPGKKIMSEQAFLKNIETGPYKEYYENGNLKLSGNYTNGTMSGVWSEYSEDGKKSAEGTYINGLKEGKWSEFNAEGKVVKTRKYVKGEEVQ